MPTIKMDDVAYMYKNNGGGFWDDGLGIEQEQHHQGFEFQEDPLFRQHDHTMDEYTVVDDDAGNEGYASMDEADAMPETKIRKCKIPEDIRARRNGSFVGL
jgi:hypothetical protein